MPQSTEIHQNQEQPELVLYYFQACPFCFRVLEVLKSLNLNVEMRDTRENPEYRQFLQDNVGKTQVPCLFVDGKPMHESMDIIRYLKSIS
ncbi:MAG: hypothetical protein SP1CHLAM54_07420 [Chlamydiia bacterium]|nr:hypothetical protein [Chlamydiia bacterium]MCH9615648.1 hypothetical protein [Chlamydiia bacterium]MCH9628949.1 hypothetical protein [Chlamydiia bacterium]